MKLTKEQILAFYLPFGLKFISYLDKPYEDYGHQPIWTVNGISEMFGDYCFLTKENNDAYPIKTCKPLLRPLQSLTVEQEINGERFVPIVELNKLFGYKEMRLVYYENDGLGWSIDAGFANTAVGMSDMWKPIEWCFKNHFNVFNLPEGEYVDLNTVKI